MALKVRSADKDDPIYSGGWGTFSTLESVVRKMRSKEDTGSPETSEPPKEEEETEK